MCIGKRSIAAAVSVLLSLGACGTTGQSSGTSASTYSMPSGSTIAASGYGVIQAIDMVSHEEGAVVGSSGGALPGYELQKQHAQQLNPTYRRVAIRMDNGTTQTLIVETHSNLLRLGERIHIANDVIRMA